MPDYARKKFDESKEDEYKPHYMYKGKSKIYAKKPEDHEKLKKKGYDHDDPTTKKDENLEELANIAMKKNVKNCGCGEEDSSW